MKLLFYSCEVISNSLQCHGLLHARLFCPSLSSPGVCSNSCPLSRWCHPTISSSATPFSFAFNLSQHQGLFQWIGCSHQVVNVLEFQLQRQSFQWIKKERKEISQWICRVDFLWDWLVWSPCSPRDSQESSPPQSKSINSSALSFLYGPTLTSIHDYWKNHSFD